MLALFTAPTCPHSDVDPKKNTNLLRMGLFSSSKGILVVELKTVKPQEKEKKRKKEKETQLNVSNSNDEEKNAPIERKPLSDVPQPLFVFEPLPAVSTQSTPGND